MTQTPSEEPLNDLYSRDILRFAAAISRVGRLEAPQATATAVSRLCGSKITVDLVMTDGRVSDYAQNVEACALGQTAASIMAQHIIGSTPDELRQLQKEMKAMLKDNGPPPSGKWAELAVLEAVRDYRPRHGSVMLPFNAVVDALDQIESQDKTGGE